MRSRRSLRIFAIAILAGTATLHWAGCGSGGEGLTQPDVGSIEVNATTSGPEPDADGYTVSIDGTGAHPIGPNATLRVEGLAIGTHTVNLTGAAENCAVTGDGSASVEVVGGGTAAVRFTISCRPTTGSLRITTSTGAYADPDGYTLLLDGVERQSIGPAAEAVISGIPAGDHSVGLSGLAANCRVEGENPRLVTVVAGETAALGIAVTCDAPPPATGSLTVVTISTGVDLDPDGFQFSIDDAQEQPIGTNSTVSVSGVAAGPHTIRLAGVAANCTVGGDNPQSIVVPTGGTAAVSFEVACTSATGRLRITTRTSGTPRDPDGYGVSIDDGTSRPIGVNASLTLEDLSAGSHEVTLDGVAANCLVQGENPRRVTIAAEATSATEFEVTCAATTGELIVTISGLPGGVDAAVTVTGPAGFSRQLTGTATLDELAAGDYTISAARVGAGEAEYAPSPETQTATVSAGEAATARVNYTRVGGPSLNLRIDGLYLTQSVQTPARSVPLIEGRDGYLRVFAIANEGNTARPTVRVRLFRNNNPLQTLTLTTTQASTPTRVEEGVLARSWNIPVPGRLIQRGLQIAADVDPDNTVAESDEGDNTFPASGGRTALEVRPAARLRVVLVPIRQRANGMEGNVTNGNRDQFLDLSQRLHPIPGYDAEVHGVYLTTTSKPLDGNLDNWHEVVNELLAIRAVEGDDRNYYGVVRVDPGAGLAGAGLLRAPAAIGYDEPSDASRVMAHELGHNWGRLHSACGNPGNVDPEYPYPGGSIGVYGLDVAGALLKTPELPDVMGYCRGPWVSDFNYEAILQFRETSASAGAFAGAAPRPSLLIWGRIERGLAILEPAFHVVTRPSVPAGGPYTVSGHASDGATLFNVSFDAVPVADAPGGSRQFAFTVPLDPAAAARLVSLRLTGAGITTTATARAPDRRQVGPAADAIDVVPAPGRVAIQWDAGANPMIMVRDPDTRQVLSFARGGRAEVPTGKRTLDLVVSDGVRSREIRGTVPGR